MEDPDPTKVGKWYDVGGGNLTQHFESIKHRNDGKKADDFREWHNNPQSSSGSSRSSKNCKITGRTDRGQPFQQPTKNKTKVPERSSPFPDHNAPRSRRNQVPAFPISDGEHTYGARPEDYSMMFGVVRDRMASDSARSGKSKASSTSSNFVTPPTSGRISEAEKYSVEAEQVPIYDDGRQSDKSRRSKSLLPFVKILSDREVRSEFMEAINRANEGVLKGIDDKFAQIMAFLKPVDGCQPLHQPHRDQDLGEGGSGYVVVV